MHRTRGDDGRDLLAVTHRHSALQCELHEHLVARGDGLLLNGHALQHLAVSLERRGLDDRVGSGVLEPDKERPGFAFQAEVIVNRFPSRRLFERAIRALLGAPLGLHGERLFCDVGAALRLAGGSPGRDPRRDCDAAGPAEQRPASQHPRS